MKKIFDDDWDEFDTDHNDKRDFDDGYEYTGTYDEFEYLDDFAEEMFPLNG